MKFMQLLILMILAMSLNGHAAKITDDTLTIGKPGSSDNKVIKLGSKVIRTNEASGKLEFSNDGSLFKKFGSGSGGGAGAISIIENGGFEDGVTSGWSSTSGTVTSIAAPLSLLGETSAQFDPTAQDDYLRTDYITVPKGLRGAACEARFLYTGSDRNVYAKVETESGVTLGSFRYQDGANGIPSHTIPGYESVFFKCPTEADITTLATNGNIRLVLYQGTATDADLGVFDDVHFGGLIGLIETTTPDTLSARIAGSNGTVTGENVDWIDGNCTRTAAGQYSCNYVANTFTVIPNCFLISSQSGIRTGVANLSSGGINSITFTTTGFNTPDPHYLDINTTLICQKQGADAKQSVQVYKSIPKIAENVNTFSAYMSGATGSVYGENVDWINGSCSWDNTTKLYTCPIVSGLFSGTPHFSCTQISGGSASTTGSHTCYFTTITQTSVSFRLCYTVGGTSVCGQYDAILTAAKSNADFKMPTVQPMVIGQVTNSMAESALTNIRIESCKINNTGTAALSDNCASWVASASRTSAGTISANIKAGIFSATPVCVMTPEDSAAVNEARVFASASTFGGKTLMNNVATDANAFFMCQGKR